MNRFERRDVPMSGDESSDESMAPKNSESVSRRDFLRGASALGAALMMGETGKGGDASRRGGEKANVEHQVERFRAGENEKNLIGKYEEENLLLSYHLLPRTNEEVQAFREFLKFIHGEKYREEMSQQLTMREGNPSRFDEKGWEFTARYFKGDKVAPIEVFSTSKEDVQRSAYFYQKLHPELTWEEAVQKAVFAEQDHWDPQNRSIVLNTGKLFEWSAMPPSITLRHEADHATQTGRGGLQPKENGQSSPREVVSLFDGVQMVLIDAAIRRERGLPPYNDEKGREIYNKPIRFPSGVTLPPRALARLAERFFEVSSSKENFERTSVQLFASPAGIQFFNRLVYGDAGRSGALQQAVDAQLNKQRDFKKDYDANLQKYFERLKASSVWNDYVKYGGGAKNAEQEMNEYMKKNPLQFHRETVVELRITDDPLFELQQVKGWDGKDEWIVRERTASRLLREAIAADPEAEKVLKENFIEW